MTGFAVRSRAAERIDDPDLPGADYAAAMRDLERVNRLLFANMPTFAFLRQAAAGRQQLQILDVGCGHGDYLRAIARWAERQKIAVALTGIDLSPAAIAAASAATPPSLGIRFVAGDIFTYQPATAPDVIVSALFTHHLSDDQIIAFLRWMEQTARLGWHINDLHRHPLAWHGFRLLATVMRWHPIVRHDGALSVRRAFVRRDWQALLVAAGIAQGVARIRWWPLFRYAVGRLR
jgi:SAM-dependent methyltransferase